MVVRATDFKPSLKFLNLSSSKLSLTKATSFKPFLNLV